MTIRCSSAWNIGEWTGANVMSFQVTTIRSENAFKILTFERPMDSEAPNVNLPRRNLTLGHQPTPHRIDPRINAPHDRVSKHHDQNPTESLQRRSGMSGRRRCLMLRLRNTVRKTRPGHERRACLDPHHTQEPRDGIEGESACDREHADESDQRARDEKPHRGNRPAEHPGD